MDNIKELAKMLCETQTQLENLKAEIAEVRLALTAAVLTVEDNVIAINKALNLPSSQYFEE